MSDPINLKFTRLTSRQKEVIDQTQIWINDLINNHKFKHEAQPNGYGYSIKATRVQDAPVRARLEIYIDIVIDEPRQDEFILSDESSISLNCKVNNRDPSRADFFGDSMGPFTLVTLNKAKAKIAQLIARF